MDAYFALSSLLEVAHGVDRLEDRARWIAEDAVPGAKESILRDHLDFMIAVGRVRADVAELAASMLDALGEAHGVIEHAVEDAAVVVARMSREYPAKAGA